MADRDPDPDDSARLVEAVLRDPELRALLRRDQSAEAALETLEIRESKSSLAGVLAAAAVEGLALYELVEHGGLGAGVAEAAEAPPSLLNSSNVTFDAAGVADLRAGRIDPRIVAVLEEIGRHHRITVSAMLSDHDVHTAGGSISNHHYGRAVDIAVVDGQPVSPGNAAARELAQSLLRLDRGVRPTELGSPWALGDPVAFTDGDHQDHIHVAFDDPPPAGWKPPAPAPDLGAAEETGSSDDAVDADDSESSDLDDVDEPDDEDDEEEDDDQDEDEDDDEDEDEDDDEDEDEDEDDSDGEDEDEPDEDEPDEVGPDFDDLHDDEYQAGASAPPPPVAPPESDGEPVAIDGVPTEYPGDEAPPEHVAAWMAGEAQRRGLPAELPVMAALVESGMRNLPGGDADSVGFFQMRTSIWNSGEYVGYAGQPHLQLEWFLDHAEQVRDQRVARGLPVRDPGNYGEWIADVERPAEQYRGRYQLRLEEARELLRGFQPDPGPDANQAQVLPVIRADQVTRRPR